MKLEEAEDLWLACVMQAPRFAKHSRVTTDHLSNRASRILKEVLRVADEGWTLVEPSQLRGCNHIIGSIPKRLRQVDAPSTIELAETALIDAWSRHFYANALAKAAKICEESGLEAAEAARLESFRVVEAHTAGIRWVSVGEAAMELYREYQRTLHNPTMSSFLMTGFLELDEAVRFWQPECMTVIGSYTSEGKSTLTVQILTALAIHGTKVAYISLEDRPTIVTKRQIAAFMDRLELVSQLNADRPTQELVDELLYVIEGGLLELPMDIIYGPKYTIDRICYAIQDAARRGAKVVAVDYLQRLKDKRYKRTEFLSECVSRMKSAAAEVGVHLILVSQVVRPENKQKKDRPTMYMLKETGDIENEAEYVILPFRANKGADGPYEDASIFVDKAKDGRAPAVIQARWDATRHLYSLLKIAQDGGGWS